MGINDLIFAQNSRQLFGQVYRGFESSGATPQVIAVALLTLAAILAAVLGYVIYKRFFVSRSEQKLFFGEITGAETVSSIIDQAVVQRSKVMARFSRKNRPFDCAIYKAEQGEIVLEPPYFVQPTPKWLTKQLECNFRIGLDSRNFLFYSFYSPIIGFEDMQGVRMLRLTYPQSLFLGQKRRHLRIEPPARWVYGLAVWQAVRGDDSGFESRMDFWGRPVARLEGKKQGLLWVGLMDISAGGARLRLPREAASVVEKIRETYPYLFVYMSLSDGNHGVERFVLVARIKYSHVEYEQDFFSVSLEFVRSGRVKSKKHRLLQWGEVDSAQGVEDLGNWVFQRHLQLYREKGTG